MDKQFDQESLNMIDQGKPNIHFHLEGLGDTGSITEEDAKNFQERKRKFVEEKKKNEMGAWSCASVLPTDPSDPVAESMTIRLKEEGK